MSVVIAPHPDDEIIGLWSLLKMGKINEVVYYKHENRAHEAMFTAKYYGFKASFPKPELLPKYIKDYLLEQYDTIYVPHPLDHHPDHRYVTLLAQSIVPVNKLVYYTTDMNIPWALHSLGSNAQLKYLDLIKCYPSQKKDFDVNRHWWLFEGITEHPSLPYITVEVPFLGYHYYPNAPVNRQYLKYPHQHVFNVKVRLAVTDLNRQVEFHDLRDELYKLLPTLSRDGSMEMWARYIWSELKQRFFTYIEVCVCEEGNLCGCYGDMP